MSDSRSTSRSSGIALRSAGSDGAPTPTHRGVIARENGARLLPQEYTAAHHPALSYACQRRHPRSPALALWRRLVSVTVHDTKTGDAFELPVGDSARALDVYHHPYAYAGERPGVASSHSRRHPDDDHGVALSQPAGYR